MGAYVEHVIIETRCDRVSCAGWKSGFDILFKGHPKSKCQGQVQFEVQVLQLAANQCVACHVLLCPGFGFGIEDAGLETFNAAAFALREGIKDATSRCRSVFRKAAEEFAPSSDGGDSKDASGKGSAVSASSDAKSVGTLIGSTNKKSEWMGRDAVDRSSRDGIMSQMDELSLLAALASRLKGAGLSSSTPQVASSNVQTPRVPVGSRAASPFDPADMEL